VPPIITEYRAGIAALERSNCCLELALGSNLFTGRSGNRCT
jgi:hypothetical protein